jgi:ribonuclease Z
MEDLVVLCLINRYSGDTRPCSSFAVAGENSDLLIHEATFEDGLKEDAISKRHSTFSEAVEIATEYECILTGRMKAKCVILTHFSQRYPKIPVISGSRLAVGIAFDFLTVKLSNAHRLSSHWPQLTEIFAEEEGEEGI